MTTILWIAGATALFFGRDIKFVFTAFMAGFLALRFPDLLPISAPYWADVLLIVVIGLLAGWAATANKEVGYYVSGALAGGYVISDVLQPAAYGVPLIPFVIAAVLAAVMTGLLNEWGILIVSCMTGAYIIYKVLPLYGTEKTLAIAGIFVLGALAQVILFQMQKHSE